MIVEAKRNKFKLINETIENGIIVGAVRCTYIAEDKKFATTVSIAGKNKAAVTLEADANIKDIIKSYGNFGEDVQINISGDFKMIYE